MKVSEFLRREIAPFLYGAFMSRIMSTNECGKKYFYCYTKFKISKLVPPRVFSISTYGEKYIDELNFVSGVMGWTIIKCNDKVFEARLYLENDLALTDASFYNMLRSKFFKTSWVHDDGLTDDKKDFIRGFLELRGSVDITAKYISQDYFFNNRVELKKALIITDFMSVPIKYANYNMRELQFQFVMGISKRNPQFRINSFYYAKYIGFLNKYKACIFEKAFCITENFEKDGIKYFQIDLPSTNSDDVAFIKYLNFFSNNVYQKELTTRTVEELRKRMGFHKNESNETDSRNMSIVELFDAIAPDKCAICNTETTYARPNGRQYFEIHHVISRCNGKELDNIANLVKLCPTCHRMMKRNGAPKVDQIRAIIKILNEHTEIYEFCCSYLNIDNINELAEKIQGLLG
ncbi:MAG: HNH endonuclease [Candidatus Enteromonas sp.]|nr:HNH endonuclease [Candidatus Enteromonas sp.]